MKWTLLWILKPWGTTAADIKTMWLPKRRISMLDWTPQRIQLALRLKIIQVRFCNNFFQAFSALIIMVSSSRLLSKPKRIFWMPARLQREQIGLSKFQLLPLRSSVWRYWTSALPDGPEEPRWVLLSSPCSKHLLSCVQCEGSAAFKSRLRWRSRQYYPMLLRRQRYVTEAARVVNVIENFFQSFSDTNWSTSVCSYCM